MGKGTVMKFHKVLMTVLLMGYLVPSTPRAEEPVTVFAASSLVDVLTSLEKTYEDRSGGDIRISFAASSVLAHQIENGAPADIFISANSDWVDFLIDKGLTAKDRTAVLAENTLVLIIPETGKRENFARLAEFDISAWIGAKERLAIADPDHVPAGIYAKQALQALERWEAVEDRLAIANNVRAALLLVSRGEVPLGIVYRTDAKASGKVQVLTAIPPRTHDPIRYRIARLGTKTSPKAQAFWDFLFSPDAVAILRKHGFIAF